jgi:DNA repair protein RadC
MSGHGKGSLGLRDASTFRPWRGAAPGAADEHALLSAVLGSACRRSGEPELIAARLLEQFGTFGRVLAASPDELRRVPGVNASRIAKMRLIRDAALHLARAEVSDRPIINNYERLMDYLQIMLAHTPVEVFRVLFLDSHNRLLADKKLSEGTVNHVQVYPREVTRRALELNATALILVHNHPSGDPTPSGEDLSMTGDIRRAVEPLGITIHDHLIIGNGRWTSLRREGLL